MRKLRKAHIPCPDNNTFEPILQFLRERQNNPDCKVLHVFDEKAAVVLSSDKLLENGRQALLDENPVFHVDGTGSETSNRWRIVYLCCSAGLTVFPVCLFLCPTEAGPYFEQLLQCAIAEGALADLAKVTMMSDNGSTEAIKNIIPNVCQIDCFAHLVNRSFTPNIKKFSTTSVAHRFINDVRCLARSCRSLFSIGE